MDCELSSAPRNPGLPCRHSCESRNPDIFPAQAGNQNGPCFSTGWPGTH